MTNESGISYGIIHPTEDGWTVEFYDSDDALVDELEYDSKAEGLDNRDELIRCLMDEFPGISLPNA